MMPDEDASADAPQPAEPATQPARKPLVSKGAIIAVIVGFVTVLVVGWYREEITSFWKLKPWDRSSPCNFVEALSDAVKAGDVEAVRAAMGGPSAVVEVTDGAITAVKPAETDARVPAMPAEFVRLSGEAPESGVKYVFHPVMPSVAVSAPVEAGGTGTFDLFPTDGGSWVVKQIARPH